MLRLETWKALPNAFRSLIGLAQHFYTAGASLAHEAQNFYESRLSLAGVSSTNPEVANARKVFEGSAGVDRVERSVTDATWFKVSGDYDLYQRALVQAAILKGVDEDDVTREVEARLAFYERDKIQNLEGELRRVQTLLEIEKRRSRRRRTRFPRSSIRDGAISGVPSANDMVALEVLTGGSVRNTNFSAAKTANFVDKLLKEHENERL
ncbi:hypothetical protein CH273_02160 [Rhodococcus sp. 05-339-2]|nr:hypothetical protein CH273_02160 [Rhodococcus sp. 05-339-2]